MIQKPLKKRELLPKLNELINYLVEMGPDIAKLELHDNVEASKRTRIKILKFRNIIFKEFESDIKAIRVDIVPRRNISKE